MINKIIIVLIIITLFFSCRDTEYKAHTPTIFHNNNNNNNKFDTNSYVSGITSKPLKYIGKINSNDSLYISNKLKSSYRDVEFGNKKEGIYRAYRKINGEWILRLIQYYQDSLLIWSTIPYDKKDEGYFELDWLFLGVDSIDVTIPFETGQKWQTFSVRKGIITGKMITYYRNNKIKEILDFQDNKFTEYYKNGIKRLELFGGVLMTRNRCNDCQIKVYDRNGRLKYSAKAKRINILNNKSLRLYNGIFKNFDNDSIIVVKKEYQTIELNDS